MLTITPWHFIQTVHAAAIKSMLLCVAISSISALSPMEVYGQEVVTLSGLVKESESGETLPYASVTIAGTSIGAATNLDGHFTLFDVPAGAHTLRVSYLGFIPFEMEVETSEAIGTQIVIELVSATAELDEVVVVSDRYQMMKSAERISQITVSPKDLAVLPNVGEVDIFRSLQLLPGISATNEGSSGLFVRGGTPDQNLVLLDGMTVYHVDHFFGFFSAFNADAIKDVQVFKGGFPAQYGGRTSSVVDLAGKTGDVNNLQIGAGLNLLSSNVVAEIPLGGKGSFLLSGRRSYTDILQTGLYNSIYETLTGDDITPDEAASGAPAGRGGGGGRGGAFGAGFTAPGQAVVQPDFFFYDVNAKLTYRPTGKDVLAISFYNGQDDLNKSRDLSRDVTANGQANVSVFNNITDLTDWGNIGVSGKWSRQWSPRFYTNGLVAYSQYFSNFELSNITERFNIEADSVSFSRVTGTLEDNLVADLTARLDNEFQITQDNKLSFGFQLTRSDVNYEFVRDDTLTILDRNQEALQAVGYLQDSWKLFSRLDLTAGLRTIYYDVTDKVYLEPRFSLGIGLTDRVKLKAAYGDYNQFVARVVNENVTEGARDFWLLADGETVGIAGSKHYIVGASYDTPNWLFDVEAYHKDLSGLTEFSLRFQRNTSFAPGQGATIEANELFSTGDGVARGLEFLVQRKSGQHTGWISYTIGEVEHTFVDLNGGLPFPALHDQTHEIKLVNSFDLGRWSLSSTWIFGTGKPYTSPESQYFITLLDGAEQSFIHVGEKNSARLPDYHRLDVATHYKFDVGESRVDLGFSIFNLYNRKNVWYKEFDLSESPMVTTDFNFLGITPNLSVRVDF